MLKPRWAFLYSQILPLQILIFCYSLVEEVSPIFFAGSVLLSLVGSLIAWFSLRKLYRDRDVRELRVSLFRYLLVLEILLFIAAGFLCKPLFHFSSLGGLLILGLAIPILSWLLALWAARPGIHRLVVLDVLENSKAKNLSEAVRNQVYFLSQGQRFVRIQYRLVLLLLIVCIISWFFYLPGLSLWNWYPWIYHVSILLFLLWRRVLRVELEEGHAIGQAILPKEGDRRNRIFRPMILQAGIIAFLLLLDVKKAFFPLKEHLTWLLDLLFGWLSDKEPVTTYSPVEAPQQQGPLLNMDFNVYDEFRQNSGQPWTMPDWLERYLLIILVCIASAGLIYFLIFPLLNRNRISPKRSTNEKNKESLWQSLINWLKSLGRKKKIQGAGYYRWDQEKNRPVRSKISEKQSEQQIRNRSKSLQLFHRLCRWGKRQGKTYRSSVPPMHYLTALAESQEAPLREKLLRIAHRLQQSFYGKDPPDKEEISRIAAEIKSIERRRKG